MQLLTRLLLRLGAVGLLMLALAFVLTLFAARQDIADEIQGSQRIGQLLEALSALQDDMPLAQHAQRIDALNRSDTLRQFHVALLDREGRRLTASPRPVQTSELPWLNRFVVSEVSLPAHTLWLKRPDGDTVTVRLEPNPQPESAEAIASALVQLALFAALATALIAALAFSLRHSLLPLADILSGISRIEAGDYGARIARCATRELNQIGQALNHLAAALTEQIAKQRELLHRLQEVQENERRKLAHELHDEFGQRLTAMQVDASYLLKQTALAPALHACAQAMYENSSSILSQLRSLLAQLRPYGLQGDEEHGIALEEALRELVRQRQSRGEAALECHLHTALDGETLPPRLAVAVYRIAQEALTNVMRHSGATRVSISLEVDRGTRRLNLTIADNGKGMPEHPSPGLGLAGIRERVLAHQGELAMMSAEPHGLTLKASFPLC
jgi:two-component system, NarL family, sensor histidine kinase UhpB